MDLNQIYEWHRFIERKERGAFTTYGELDRLYNIAQLDLTNIYLDEYAISGKIHNALSPFKKTYTFTLTTSANGKVALPSDYLMMLADCHTIGYNNEREEVKYGEIRFYNENQWVNAINSQLRPPTKKKPAAKIATGYMEMFPKIKNAGVLSYIKRPNPPVYVYTESGRTITYNAAASTQLEWLDIYIPKLIMQAFSYQGINLNEPQITQYAEMKSKETV